MPKMKASTATGPLFLLLVSFTRAQSTTPSTLQTVTSASSTTTTSPTSTPSDLAPGGDGSQPSPYNKGIVNYYFVFLALILCVVGLGAFLIWRRKRRMGALLRNSRDNSLARDLSTWDPVRPRRRYWQGRWRSTDVSREEGLNEEGEAPPPYVPKTQQDNPAEGLAVPLQTLSRDQAGLKPPDYTEAAAHPVNAQQTSPPTNIEASSRSESRPTE